MKSGRILSVNDNTADAVKIIPANPKRWVAVSASICWDRKLKSDICMERNPVAKQVPKGSGAESF